MAESDTIAHLTDLLARHPPERYPIQHATAQYHLGVLFTDAGRTDEAERALDTAVGLFAGRLAAEHAKATNARGAALRLAGRLNEAADAFRRAASLFDTEGLHVEHGAALFNLGLVERDRGRNDAALRCFEEARGRLDPEKVPAQAAAAARELGATLLTTGRAAAARETLEAALEAAHRLGVQAAVGASANVLGLACLAEDRPEAALEAFRVAVAAHPRAVRPGDYAMAKANLALAHERTGDTDRARLAAMQALGAPGAAEPVRAQAEDMLGRLGRAPGAVLTVLDDEPIEHWPVLLREELVRWGEAEPDRLRAECEAWIDGQLARGPRGQDLAEAWLAVLLELPPQAMEQLIGATVEELGARDDDAAHRFRADVNRAMARFHVPQLMRLRETFTRLAAELGQEASWG